MRVESGEFKPYTGVAFILILSRDQKNWWAKRLIGFLKVCEDINDRTLCYWVPSYIEESFVSPINEKQKATVVYDRKPTKYDAKQLSESSVIDFVGGELDDGMEVVYG